MMGKRFLERGFCGQSIAVLVAILGLNACAMAQKPAEQKPTKPVAAKEITLMIAEDGSISVKGGEGATIDQRCNLDPNAKDACPIYEKGKRIQMERIEPVILMKYQVNPGCYLIGLYSYAQLICYP